MMCWKQRKHEWWRHRSLQINDQSICELLLFDSGQHVEALLKTFTRGSLSPSAAENGLEVSDSVSQELNHIMRPS